MLWITCPHCGARPETEFAFGGEAVARPEAPDSVSDAAWSAYLYERENRLGAVRERWWHRAGCATWFWIERHTGRDEIAPSAKAGEGGAA